MPEPFFIQSAFCLMSVAMLGVGLSCKLALDVHWGTP